MSVESDDILRVVMHMSDHLKQQIKGKMQERDRLEAMVLECSTRLDTSGVGLHEPLVDKEVYLSAKLFHQHQHPVTA